LYDRRGKIIKDSVTNSQEAGTALGGGGDTSTAHVKNWFNGIRGVGKLNSHIMEGAISQTMVHYSNVAYRIGHGFDICDKTGIMYDRDAMELWGREYDSNWEPKL